jgi:hypothetical protein
MLYILAPFTIVTNGADVIDSAQESEFGRSDWGMLCATDAVMFVFRTFPDFRQASLFI